jgi:glutamate/aspartate transport system permease protein
MTLMAMAIALPIACLFAAGRLSANPLIRYPTVAYVNILRNSPLVMSHVLGLHGWAAAGSADLAALVALAAFEVAYFTAIIRSGIQSGQGRPEERRAGERPHRGASDAAHRAASGVAADDPSLLTQSLIAFQDSTIASVIGVPDILKTTTVINARERDPIFPYSSLVAIYFVVCCALSRLVRRLEQRSRLRMGVALTA